jgi:hypothetical protein
MYPGYIKIKQTIRRIFDSPASVDSEQLDDGTWTLLATYDLLGRRIEDAHATGCLIEVYTNGKINRSKTVMR